MHFVTVHAAVSANCFAIYGARHRDVMEPTVLVQGILNQLVPNSLASPCRVAGIVSGDWAESASGPVLNPGLLSNILSHANNQERREYRCH
ncbi:hypothetical protein EI94DRAFT_1332735 [Lactarius quietus]|nr:hypothetical protein EI94DRAFT_1332735 [Lactarius quietus]